MKFTQDKYRLWQANQMFAARWFTPVFARTMRFWASPLYRWAAEPLQEHISQADSIVDVGAGNGNFLWYAVKGHNPKRLTFVDKNEAQLAAGHINLAPLACYHEVQTIVAAAEQIPLPDASASLVVTTGSINLWNDPVQGLRECWRILRPGGHLWLYDQGPCQSVSDIWDALFVRRMFGLGLPGFTLDQILEFGEQALAEDTGPLRHFQDHSFYGICWRKPL